MAALEKEQKISLTKSRRQELFKDGKTGKSSTDIAHRFLNTIHLADTSVLNKKEADVHILPLLKDNPRYQKANRLAVREYDHPTRSGKKDPHRKRQGETHQF